MNTNNTFKLAAILITVGALSTQATPTQAKSVKRAKPTKANAKAKAKAKAFSFNSGQPLLMSDSMKRSMARQPKRRARTRRPMKRFGSRSIAFRINRHASATPMIEDNKDVAGAPFGKKLSARVVDQTIRRNSKALYRCRGYAIGPRAVTVKLSVSANGRVHNIRVLSGLRLERSAYTKCLARRIVRWSFPHSTTMTPVSFGFRPR